LTKRGKNMKKLLSGLQEKFNDFMLEKPGAEDKAWGMILDYYHFILTYMEENNISKADLARSLKKSRAAVSQMFNKTPNITIKKMVEIADAIGVDFTLIPEYEIKKMGKNHVAEVVVYPKDFDKIPITKDPVSNVILPFDRESFCGCPEINLKQKQYLD